MQVKYATAWSTVSSTRELDDPQVVPRYHYTRDSVPGLFTKGTPHQSLFGQLIVDVELDLETAIKAFLKISPPLRCAVRYDKVKKIKDQLLPCITRQGKACRHLHLPEGIEASTVVLLSAGSAL